MAATARTLPTESAPRIVRAEPFRLRGATFHLMVLRLTEADPDRVGTAIADLFRRAPGFLRFAPVVVGLDELDASAAPDLAPLVESLRRYEVVPIGFTGGHPALRSAALAAGLPPLKANGEQDATTSQPVREPAQPQAAPVHATPPPVPEPSGARPTLVIDQPVRSGQRIYAEAADLVVNGTVNVGAEVIADGHIHIFGALRGRAIAGGMANEAARITSLRFDPELVAIAGTYATRESLGDAPVGRAVQVRLANERLQFQPVE